MTEPDSEIRRILTEVKAFADLPAELINAMWDCMEERSFAADEALMRQQDPGDCLLVLLEGSVRVTARDQVGVERQIGGVKAGEVAGEMALITGERRGADVVAEEPVRALALPAERRGTFSVARF
jgi:CRP-like cAMP-binding protein